ncbi:hypothetical protein C8F01DRAFT_1152894 [Mycena amicta]|nr:hypothetical protein C8F01DRAFT_1152894 [Mycena amicta]
MSLNSPESADDGIAGLTAELDAVNVEASNLIILLAPILAKKNRIEWELVRRRNARVPLLSLPAELLVCIVEEWLHLDDCRVATVVASHICQALPLRKTFWDGVFSAASRLVELTVHCTSFFCDAASATIRLPHLRTFLMMTFVSGTLLNAIYAPALKEMEFTQLHGRQVASFFDLLPVPQFTALRAVTFANSESLCDSSQCPRMSQSRSISRDALCRFTCLSSLILLRVCFTTCLLGDLLATTPRQQHKGQEVRPLAGLSALRSLTLSFRASERLGIYDWEPDWPPLVPTPPREQDPFPILRRLVKTRNASDNDYPSLSLHVSKSRYLTEKPTDWEQAEGEFEIVDVNPILTALDAIKYRPPY